MPGPRGWVHGCPPGEESGPGAQQWGSTAHIPRAVTRGQQKAFPQVVGGQMRILWKEVLTVLRARPALDTRPTLPAWTPLIPLGASRVPRPTGDVTIGSGVSASQSIEPGLSPGGAELPALPQRAAPSRPPRSLRRPLCLSPCFSNYVDRAKNSSSGASLGSGRCPPQPAAPCRRPPSAPPCLSVLSPCLPCHWGLRAGAFVMCVLLLMATMTRPGDLWGPRAQGQVQNVTAWSWLPDRAPCTPAGPLQARL